MSRYPKRPEDLPALKAALADASVSATEALEVAFLDAPHRTLHLLDRLRLRDLARKTAQSDSLVFLHLLGVHGRDATKALSWFEVRSARWIKAIARKKLRSLVDHLAPAIAQSRDVRSSHRRFVTALAFGKHRLYCTRANERWGYRTFYLRKSSGNYRRIDAPSPALKRLLRRALNATEERVRKRFRWTGAGGCIQSPVEHAATHLGGEFVVSFDIKDFYPSTTRRAVLDGFRCMALAKRGSRLTGYQDELCDALVTALGTRCGILPQGSPTSALLADVAFFPFERRIRAKLAELASRHGIEIRYSRYADDIVVSYCLPSKTALSLSVGTVGDSSQSRFASLRREIQLQRDELLAVLRQSDEIDAEMIFEILAELEEREAKLDREQSGAEGAPTIAPVPQHLAVEVSVDAEKSPPIDARAFRQRVEACIEGVLRRSPYRLNSAKTDSGTPDQGFEITGIVLRRGADRRIELDLPRTTRNELRGHLHCIATRGLSAAALRWKANRSLTPARGLSASAHRSRLRRLAARLCRHFRIATARIAPHAPTLTSTAQTVDPHTGIPFARISAQQLVYTTLRAEAKLGDAANARRALAELVGSLTGRDTTELAESAAGLADLAEYLEYLHGMRAHVSHIAAHAHASARLKSLANTLSAALGCS